MTLRAFAIAGVFVLFAGTAMVLMLSSGSPSPPKTDDAPVSTTCAAVAERVRPAIGRGAPIVHAAGLGSRARVGWGAHVAAGRAAAGHPHRGAAEGGESQRR